MIVVVARRTIKAEKKDEYLKLVAKMAEETRKEEGCVTYECCQKNVFPLEIAMVEKWKSQEHLNAHFETPHFDEFVKAQADLLDDKGPIDIYTVVV